MNDNTPRQRSMIWDGLLDGASARRSWLGYGHSPSLGRVVMDRKRGTCKEPLCACSDTEPVSRCKRSDSRCLP
jgi:hypothetical protein